MYWKIGNINNNINVKMLEEMINGNFLEVSKEEEKAINGGKKWGNNERMVSIYYVGPIFKIELKFPKFSLVRALSSVQPSILDLRRE